MPILPPRSTLLSHAKRLRVDDATILMRERASIDRAQGSIGFRKVEGGLGTQRRLEAPKNMSPCSARCDEAEERWPRVHRTEAKWRLG